MATLLSGMKNQSASADSHTPTHRQTNAVKRRSLGACNFHWPWAVLPCSAADKFVADCAYMQHFVGFLGEIEEMRLRAETDG